MSLIAVALTPFAAAIVETNDGTPSLNLVTSSGTSCLSGEAVTKLRDVLNSYTPAHYTDVNEQLRQRIRSLQDAMHQAADKLAQGYALGPDELEKLGQFLVDQAGDPA